MMRLVRESNEAGAIAILYAVVLMLLIGLAALVLDLGATRADVRAAQSTADFASTAGAFELEDGSPRAACVAALDSVADNSPEIGTGDLNYSLCDTFPTDDQTCYADQPDFVTLSQVFDADPYEITLAWPWYFDDEDYTENGYEATRDGNPCERFSVQINRTRGFMFGGATGFDQLQVGRPAVARAAFGEAGEDIANLLILDKVGCIAFDVAGGGTAELQAKKHENPETGEDEWVTGKAYVDSSGADCTGQQKTIRTSGGGATIHAHGDDEGWPDGPPGEIRLYALPSSAVGDDATCNHPPGMTPDGRNPSAACREADVTSEQIWPRPEHLPARTNRTPADHRYNCKSDYSGLNSAPDSPENHRAPGSLSWNVSTCSDATGDNNHIDQVRSLLGGPGTPAGFQRWQDPGNTEGGLNCNYSGDPLELDGNWYIDCPGPNGLRVGSKIEFTGGNVVFQHQLNMRPEGQFLFNTANQPGGEFCSTTVTIDCLQESSSDAALIYFRNAGIDMTSAPSGEEKIDIANTAVILRDGRVRINDGEAEWSGPQAGVFEALALWTDGNHLGNSLGGGSAIFRPDGVFFAPNSQITVTGGTSGEPVDSQFFAWRINVPGGGTLSMTPAPDRALPIPVFEGVKLLR